jgi:hypothetical protein
LGIDKKRQINEQLDRILRESEKCEESLMLQEFRGLVIATVELCSQLEYTQIVRECSQAF